MILVVAGFSVHGMGRERRIVYSHVDQYHPVIYLLFDGEIKAQQDAKQVIRNFPPSTISKHDDYMTLLYTNDDATLPPCCISGNGYVHVITMDNKLVKAFAVEGTVGEIEYVFFNDFNTDLEEDYSASRWRDITTR